MLCKASKKHSRIINGHKVILCNVCRLRKFGVPTPMMLVLLCETFRFVYEANHLEMAGSHDVLHSPNILFFIHEAFFFLSYALLRLLLPKLFGGSDAKLS